MLYGGKTRELGVAGGGSCKNLWFCAINVCILLFCGDINGVVLLNDCFHLIYSPADGY